MSQDELISHPNRYSQDIARINQLPAYVQLSNIFIKGEARFLLACLAKDFNPSVVFVAQSNFLIASCFKALKRARDFSGSATTSSQAIDLLTRTKPGIVAIYESGSSCIYSDVVNYISTSCPKTRSLLILQDVSVLNQIRYALADCIIADCDVLSPVNPMLQGLMALVAGSTYRSPSVASHLESSAFTADKPSSDRIILSQRDKQLLESYVLGLSNREVAERLNLSVRTVQTYSGNLLHRLGVNNRQKAILKAIKLGFAVGRQHLSGDN
jgi:DNA-binding NarL/FixJ family response regulator